MNDIDESRRRRIRSFVRREGRLTRAQRHALEYLLPQVGLSTATGRWDLDQEFGRQAARYVEIGFGNGISLLSLLSAYPDRDYIGIEVHRPGVGRLLHEAHQAGCNNLRVVNDDAVQVMRDNIADHSLDGVNIFFPDPWPKKRHHKRRLIKADFIALVCDKLKPQGVLHLATDVQDYAEHMLAVLQCEPRLRNLATPGPYSDRGERPPSKYEQRGKRLGHGVWDLRFSKDS